MWRKWEEERRLNVQKRNVSENIGECEPEPERPERIKERNFLRCCALMIEHFGV